MRDLLALTLAPYLLCLYHSFPLPILGFSIHFLSLNLTDSLSLIPSSPIFLQTVTAEHSGFEPGFIQSTLLSPITHGLLISLPPPS